MKAMKWVICNGVFGTLAWLGVTGLEGAGNVVVFFVWFMAIASLITAKPQETDPAKLAERAKRNVPAVVSGTFHVFMVGLFIWHGWWLTGAAFVVYAAVTQGGCMSAQRKLAQVSARAAAAIQPTYYVRHPDDTYSVADPQPQRESA